MATKSILTDPKVYADRCIENFDGDAVSAYLAFQAYCGGDRTASSASWRDAVYDAFGVAGTDELRIADHLDCTGPQACIVLKVLDSLTVFACSAYDAVLAAEEIACQDEDAAEEMGRLARLDGQSASWNPYRASWQGAAAAEAKNYDAWLLGWKVGDLKAKGDQLAAEIELVCETVAVFARAAYRAGRALLNIGLKVGNDQWNPLFSTLRTVRGYGAVFRDSALRQSETEDTLVIDLDEPLDARTLHELASGLNQEAIAQWSSKGGELRGPKAWAWGEFDPSQFLLLDGRRLSNVIGG